MTKSGASLVLVVVILIVSFIFCGAYFHEQDIIQRCKVKGNTEGLTKIKIQCKVIE